MERDPRVRPMSREENAAYQGVTVDENGAEPQDDGQTWGGRSHGNTGDAPRGSIRYIRLGGTGTQRSFLTSLLWAAALGTLLALFIFVLVLGTIVSLIGRGRIMSWLMRKMYGR